MKLGSWFNFVIVFFECVSLSILLQSIYFLIFLAKLFSLYIDIIDIICIIFLFLFLADPPVDLNAITDQINAAITQNEKPMLLQILNANCDFLPKLLDPHWTGCGFLHRTCILGHDQLALVLMNYGCDVNIATDEVIHNYYYMQFCIFLNPTKTSG